MADASTPQAVHTVQPPSFAVAEEAQPTDRPPTNDDLAELRRLLLAPEQPQAEAPGDPADTPGGNADLGELRRFLLAPEISQAEAPRDPTDTPGNNDDLAALRRLLVAPEQHQLKALQEQVNYLSTLSTSAEDVSRVLPEAVHQRSRQDRQLVQVLTPTIEEALIVSVKNNPQTLVEAISPVMGPAIRKAVAQALQGMVQSLNQTIETKISPQAIRWRIEAMWSGKSFDEILMLRTLLYRVEQVFLIHKQTGLLLQHADALGVETGDPELISGMLTAIQDFMQDSFHPETGEPLDTFHAGERTVWVEQGTQVILAVVIWGSPPYHMRSVLQDTLDRIQLEYGLELDTFSDSGDASPFEMCEPYLQACLLQQTGIDVPRTKLTWVSWIPVGLLLLGLGGWIFFGVRDARRWATYVQALRDEPGIVVTAAEKQRGRYRVTGLRDPLATDPQTLLQGAKLSPDKVQGDWEPYHAFTPAFVLARAKQVLQPPKTVTLRLQDDVLFASGSAPQTWIDETRQLARLISGVRDFRDHDLVNEATRRFAALKALLDPPETVTLRLAQGVLSATGRAPHAWIVAARQKVHNHPDVTIWQEERLVDADVEQLVFYKTQVETQLLHFVRGAPELVTGQDERLQDIIANIQALFTAAAAAGKRVHVTLFGHTDQAGSEAINNRLSQERVAYVITLLAQRGLDTSGLSAVGVGATTPARAERTEAEEAFNRRASFHVDVGDEASHQ